MPFKPVTTVRTLAFTAAGVLLVEALMHLLPEGQMTQTLHFRLNEIRELPEPEVEIMGDSVAAGLPASVIAEQFGGSRVRVSNYALDGTSPFFAPFVLQRQITEGKAPRAIIYAPHPANLSTPMFERFFGRFATFHEAALAMRYGVPVSDDIFGLLCKASYTLRYRQELRTVVTDGRLEYFQSMKLPPVSVQTSEVVQPLPAPPPPRRFDRAELSPQLTRPLSIDALNSAAIDRFCQLAATQNIPIFWVSLPAPKALDQSGTTAAQQYRAYLDDLAARHSNVILLHPQIDTLPDENFSDPWHLTKYAAWLFAQSIGQELAGALPNPEKR